MSTCPHPEKRRHPTEADAWAHATTRHPDDLTLRPYRCGGHWHVGHKSKKTSIQTAATIKAGSKNARLGRRRKRR